MASPFGSFPYDAAGIDLNSHPLFIKANRAPTSNDVYSPGTRWMDDSVSPKALYETVGGGTWQQNNLTLSTDGTFAAATDSTASSSLAIKTYVDATASFGAPIASDSAQGIGWTATDAQCVAGTANDASNAYIVSPDNLAAIFASPNAAIGATAAVAGTFTDLTADGTGAVSLTGNAASTLTNTAGDLTVDAQAGSLVLDSGEATADAVRIVASNGAGGIDIDSGTGGITIDSTDAISIDAAAASNFTTSAGDVTIQATTGSVNINALEDAAQAIYLHANGGTSETIQLHSDQGTGATSVYLLSDVGGITLTATGLTDANAIDINASAGGIDVDAAGQVNIASSQNASDAVSINASAGGIEIIAVGAAAEDLVLQNTNGSVNVVAGEADAAAVSIQAASGGLDADFALSCDIVSSQAAATAISLNASDGAGGVTIAAGTGGLLFGNQADCTTIDVGDIAPTASRTITIAGGTVVTASVTDLVDIAPDGATTNADSIKQVDINTGTVAIGQSLTNIATGAITSGTHTVGIQTGNAAAGTVTLNVSTGTGTKTINVGNADAGTTMNIDGVVAINNNVNANVSINDGTSTGTITIGNTAAGAVVLNSGSTITIGDASAGAVAIDTAAGVSIDAATASNLTCAAGDMTVEATAGSLNLTSGEAVADSVVVTSGGGIDILAPSGGAGVDIDIVNTGGSCNISATEADAAAIVINASAGGLQLLAGGGAALDTLITNTSGSISIDAGEAAADALILQASNAAGGVQINSGTGGITLGGGLNLAVTARATAGGTYTVDNDDFIIDTDSTGGAFQINLPAAPSTGDTFLIYDGAGQAAVGGNVTISGNGNNIAAGGASAATYVLNTAYESLQVTYNGTLWMGRAVA